MLSRLIALAAALVLAPAVHAQALSLISPDPTARGSFSRVGGVPDADGDGVGDLLVGARNENGDAGRAYLFSGATGALLHTLAPPASVVSVDFGVATAGIPDVDGDGRGDVAVASRGGDGEGRVDLFSGATGTLIRAFLSPDPEPNGLFGIWLAGIEDLDGDGRGDVILSGTRETGGPAGRPRVYVVSGATGDLLYTLTSPDPTATALLIQVASVPDVDGDGRPDVLVGSSLAIGTPESAGRVDLFSGATGAPIRAFKSPDPEVFGAFNAVTGVPDVDGDGRGDVVIGAQNEDGGAEDAGRAYVFSGATGALLHTLASPQPEVDGAFGAFVTDIGDYDGDGTTDVAVAASQEDGGAEGAGRVYVFSAATGALVATLSSPNPAFGGQFGTRIAGVPDAAGRGGLLVGAEFEDGGAEFSGRAYLFRNVATADDDGPDAGLPFSLAPNPTWGRTRLTLTLDRPDRIRIRLLDALGRDLGHVAERDLGVGTHVVDLPLDGLAPGIVVVRVETGGVVRSRLLTVTR